MTVENGSSHTTADFTSVIRARHLARVYSVGDVAVPGIDGIDLSIPPGTFVVLKGDSGSGKSTLLSLLGGLNTSQNRTVVVATHSNLADSHATHLLELRDGRLVS